MRKEVHQPGNGNKGSTRTSQPPLIHLPSGRQTFLSAREAKKIDQWHSGLRRVTKKPVEIATQDFPDGTRLRVILDPHDPTRTVFAAWRAGQVEYVDSFAYGDEIFVPLQIDDPLLRSGVLPRGVQPHDPPPVMARSIGALVNEVVELHPLHQLDLGVFVVLTYLANGLPVAPTVGLCGPRDITVGLLQVLGLVCRRGMLVGDVTPAGLLEACTRVKPTLLVADYGLRQDTLRLLEIGSRPAIFSLQKSGLYSPFCPRAIACSDASVGRDLLRGGLMISVVSLGWPNLELLSNAGFLERAECLRQKLLGLELASSGMVRPFQDDVPGGVAPREWDLIRYWAAPFSGDKEFVRELSHAMQWGAEASPNGLPIDQYATVSALDILAHKRRDRLSVGEIATEANRVLEQMSEGIRLADRKVGAILTKLGFPRRERGGEDGPYQLELNAWQNGLVHRLVKLYGSWQVELYDTRIRVHCPLCREYKVVTKSDQESYEKYIKPEEERRKREQQEEFQREIEELRKNPPPPLIITPAKDGAKRTEL